MNIGIYGSLKNCNYFSIKTIIFCAFLYFLLYFLLYYSLNLDLNYSNISNLLILLFFMSVIYKKSIIKPNIYLFSFSLIGYLLITQNYNLNNYYGLDYYQKSMVKHYKHYIPFILLPTIYFSCKLNFKRFTNILIFFLFFLLIYNSYNLIKFDFNRGKLVEFFNPIISYDIGFISICLVCFIYSFYLDNKKSYFYLVISILCMFSLILHGSRGTWLAIPFIITIFFIFVFMRFKIISISKIIITLSMFLMFITINVSVSNSPINKRVNQFSNDTSLIKKNNYNNSTGVRLMLWENSIIYFKRNILTGIGINNIEKENCMLYKENKIPMCYQHQHNIVFHELAANGLVGILNLFLSFLIPFIFFCFNIRSNISENFFLSITGIMFVCYYFVCGMTEYYLYFMNTTYLYYFITASIMSFIIINSNEKSSRSIMKLSRTS